MGRPCASGPATQQNAATYFLKAAEQTRSTELPSPDFVYSQLERGLRWEDKLDTVALAKGRKLLASRKQVLALIEQGARCPVSVYPVDWQAGTGAQFPHLHRTRSLSRFLGLYSLVRAMDGKPDEAFDALQLDLAVQRSLCQEPGCISLLTATSSLEKELGNLELVLRVTTPSKRKTVALYEALGRFDLFAEQAEALDDEYTLVVWRYEALRSGEYPLSPTHGLSSFWTPNPRRGSAFRAPPGTRHACWNGLRPATRGNCWAGFECASKHCASGPPTQLTARFPCVLVSSGPGMLMSQPRGASV